MLSTNWLFYVLLFDICAVAGSYLSGSFLFIAVGICLLEIMRCEEEQNFYFSIFLIPNIRILDGIGISFTVNLIMVLPLVKYIYKHHSLRKDIVFLAVTMFIIEFMHIMATDNPQRIPAFICWIMSFLYVTHAAFACQYKFMQLSSEKIYNALSVGIISSAAVYLINHISYARNILTAVTSGMRFVAYADDPNYYSLYICLSLAILFTLQRINRWHYISLGLLVTIGLLTASKMCLLLMMFIMLYAAVFNAANKEGKFSRRAILFIFTLAIYFHRYVIQFVENLLRRAGIVNGNITSLKLLTTGRSVIFMNYLEVMSSDLTTLMFGAGFSYHKYLGQAKGAHNTYLDIILAWGLVGTIVFVYVIMNIRKHFKACYIRGGGGINILPMVSLLLNFADLTCFNATMFWWVIIIAAISGTERRRYKDGGA